MPPSGTRQGRHFLIILEEDHGAGATLLLPLILRESGKYGILACLRPKAHFRISLGQTESQSQNKSTPVSADTPCPRGKNSVRFRLDLKQAYPETILLHSALRLRWFKG